MPGVGSNPLKPPGPPGPPGSPGKKDATASNDDDDDASKPFGLYVFDLAARRRRRAALLSVTDADKDRGRAQWTGVDLRAALHHYATSAVARWPNRRGLLAALRRLEGWPQRLAGT